MYNFAFMLKTCEKDLLYAKRLIESFIKYNVDEIHLFIVIEEQLMHKLKRVIPIVNNKNITILSESIFSDFLCTESIGDMSSGYINQEIIKLSFYVLGLCENYMTLDSDAFFIRDFFYNDFMYNTDEPYSVLYEDSELVCDPRYYKVFSVKKKEWIKKICDILDFHEHKIMGCHGFQIISSKVMKEFVSSVLEAKNMNYIDLMKIAPIEFSWYCIFLQKSLVIPIHPCGEIFKTIHTSYDHAISLIKNITLEDYARGYVGIIINSNISKKRICKYENMGGYIFRLNVIRLIESILISVRSTVCLLPIFITAKIKLWIRKKY